MMFRSMCAETGIPFRWARCHRLWTSPWAVGLKRGISSPFCDHDGYIVALFGIAVPPDLANDYFGKSS